MKKWVYLQSKHNMYLSPWSILICKSFTEDANKLLVNDGFQEVALSFIDGRITWYGIKNIIDQVVKENTSFIIKNPDYMKKVKKRFLKKLEKLNDFLKKIKKIDYSSLSNKGLWKLYFDYIKLYRSSYLWSEPLPFLVKETLSDYIKEVLVKKGVSDVNEYVSLLVSPNKMSFMMREEYDLLKIACKPKLFNSMINKHVNDYNWLVYDYGVKVLKESYFVQRLKKMNDPSVQLNNIECKFKDLKKKQVLLKKKLKLDRNLIKIIEVVKICSFLMDHKKEVFTKSHLIFRPVLKEIAKRLKLNLKLVQYLTIEEIRQGLLFDKKYCKEDINKRDDYSIFIFKNNGIKMLVGKEAKQFFNEKLKTKSVNSDVKVLKGTSASLGKVRGQVKVIVNTKQLNKLRKGDVLVAVMTSPDYIVAMRKASAIITDEGGMTCHAAIVSRELGIPCIVNTKIATKLLKDGDLVEVDANKGVVRKV